jgi:hypothetical protein
MFLDRVLGNPAVDDLAVEELHSGGGRAAAGVDIHGGDLNFEIAPKWVLDEKHRLQPFEFDPEILVIGGSDIDTMIARAELPEERSPEC